MSSLQFQPVKFDDFTGGWVTSKTPSNLAKSQSPDLLNVDLEKEGSFKPRRGFEYHGAEQYSISFNGSNSKIEVDESDLLNSNPRDIDKRTIVLLFKANNVSNQQVLYEQGDDSDGFNVYIEGGSVRVGTWSESANYSGDFLSTSISKDRWYQVALTFDENNTKLYTDGTQASSVSNAADDIESHSGKIAVGFQKSSSKYHDGDDTSGDNYYFDGTIDRVRVYNRVLSQSEIDDLYNNKDHGVSTNNLAARWLMDTGSGTTIRDSSGNELDGTASNISWVEGYWGDGNSFRLGGSGEVLRTHTFKRALANDEVPVRQRVDSNGNHTLEYYNSDINDWHKITIDGSTSLNSRLGFANWTASTDTEDYMYFCDGTISLQRWTGGHTLTTSKVDSGDSTIQVEDVSQFQSSGTIVINGTEVSYTGTTTNSNSPDEFTGCSGAPDAKNNAVVTDKTKDFSANKGSKPQGNIMTVWRGQLAVAQGQFVKLSQVDDFTKWSGGVSDTKGFPNGNIKALEPRQSRLVIFMEDDIFSITYKFSSDLTGHQIEVQDIEHSEGYGAANFTSVAGAQGQIAYISKDNAIRFVQQKQEVFDTGNISQNIFKNELENYDTSTASAIFYRDKFYFAVSSEDSNINDTVLIYDLSLNDKKTEVWTRYEMQVNDFFVYNDRLYFGSAAEPNCFRLFKDKKGNDIRTDDGAPISWHYKLPHLDFGAPHKKKVIHSIFSRGLINSQAEIDYKAFSNYGIEGTQTIRLYGENDKNDDNPVLVPATATMGESVMGEEDNERKFEFDNGFPFLYKEDFGETDSELWQLEISGGTSGEEFEQSRIVLQVGARDKQVIN